MAEKHTEEHSTPIKTPRQLIVVVVLAFAVPIVLIVLLTQLVTSGIDAGKSNPSMSSEAVARRLQPVGTVALDPNQPAQVAAAPTNKSAPAAAGTGGGNGKTIYDATCMVCHAAGVAGSLHGHALRLAWHRPAHDDLRLAAPSTGVGGGDAAARVVCVIQPYDASHRCTTPPGGGA